jgi:N-acetylneuraminate synthase
MNMFLSDRPFIIAEAGTCHAGSLERAKRYADLACYAGADAIKFQIFAPQVRGDMFCWIEGDESREDRWTDSALTLDEWGHAKNYAEKIGLVFLASAFQNRTVNWLNRLKVEATKVASRAAKDFPYGWAPEPYLISDGMYEPDIVDGRIYLQCEANYPSTEWWHGKRFGFSDHSGAPWRAIEAISRGCKLVEVHFYDDPADAGPDFPASLTVDQLKMVCDARDAFAGRPVAD